MKEKQILEELSQTIKSEGVDYEALKNAVETRKLVRELEGIKLSRVLAVVSLLISISLLAGQGYLALGTDRRIDLETYEEYLQGKITEFEDVLNDLEETNSEYEDEKANLEDDLAKLILQLSEKKEVERQIEELNVRKDALLAEVITLEAERSDAATLQEYLQRYQDSELETSQLRTMNASLQDSLNATMADLERLGDVSSYESIQFEQVGPGTTKQLGGYDVTFTNVGDVVENLDFSLGSADGVATQIKNLNAGSEYAVRFDDKLFLVEVESVVQSPTDKSGERGTFRIGVVDRDVKFVN